MNEALIYAVRDFFGVDSLNKVPYDRYLREVKRAVSSYTDLTASATSFLYSYAQLPTKKNGHVRPLIVGAGFSRLNEVQMSMRSLLACNSVAILVDSDPDYLIRFLWLLYFFEDYILDDSLVLIPVSFGTMFEQGLQPGIFHFIAKRMLTELLPPMYDESLGRTSDSYSLPPDFFITKGIMSSIGLAMDVVSRHPDEFDLSTFRKGDIAYVKDFLEYYLRVEESAQNNSRDEVCLETRLPDGDRLFYLPQLLDVQLPIKGVPYKYINRIREEDMFTAWVNSLRTATSELASMDERELLHPRRAKTLELRRYLSDSADKLTKGMERSQVLKRTVGASGFGIACVSGALSATSNQIVAALVGGGSFLAGNVLASFKSSRSGLVAWRRMVPNIEFGDGIPVINSYDRPFDEAGMSTS